MNENVRRDGEYHHCPDKPADVILVVHLNRTMYYDYYYDVTIELLFRHEWLFAGRRTLTRVCLYNDLI